MDPVRSAYAAVPYIEDAHRGADPPSFGAVAALHGVVAADPARARVLELGCAVGGNLIAFATRFPGAECVGVDLSEPQIEAAAARAAAVGAGNCTFLAADAADLPHSLGAFDYVISHGLYSWVPEAVREALLPAIRARLAPGGVAYVSYNALPGWHARRAVRDLLRFHVERVPDPEQQPAAAREVLGFAAFHATAGPHRDHLREVAAHVASGPDEWLFHDHLAPFNHAAWYRDVVAHGARSGLAAVGDASWHTTDLRELPEEAQATIRAWARDPVEVEQYLDLLRDRVFRQTVFVRADEPRADEPVTAELHRLHLHSDLRAQGTVDDRRRYSDGERAIVTARPALQRVMDALDAAWPGSAPLAPLVEELGEEVAAIALQLLGNGAAHATLAPIEAGRAGARPAVFRVARDHATRSPRLPTLRHMTAEVPDGLLPLVRALDGTRTVPEAADAAGLPHEVAARAVAALEARALLERPPGGPAAPRR